MDKALCDQVIAIVRQVAAFIQQCRSQWPSLNTEYKGFNDLVSYVDREAEKRITGALSRLLPEAGFLAEENTVAFESRDLIWIVDPLDGTTNYLHGVPCYSVSIALMAAGEVQLGVVHEINLNETFYSWKGSQGAWMNGEKIKVSSVSQLRESLLATGFPYTDFSRLQEYLQMFDYCLRHTHGLRRPGSAAVDLVYTAAGRYDGFFEYGLHAWDVAAGAFLVQQAGGRVSDFNGTSNFIFGKEIIACTSGIYDEFLKVIYHFFGQKSNRAAD
jgi:myo-inositol-1(or 4)-monophosphatase